MDNTTLVRIEKLHPKVRQEAKEIYIKINRCLRGKAQVRFTHTLRSIDEQNALYAQGRTKPGKKVTAAKGGESYHNYGLAIDICLLIDGKTVSWDTLKDYDADGMADWLECVDIFEKHGWDWGGRWSPGRIDMPHFQKTLGKTTTQLAELAKQAKKIGQAYVQL